MEHVHSGTRLIFGGKHSLSMHAGFDVNPTGIDAKAGVQTQSGPLASDNKYQLTLFADHNTILIIYKR